MNYLVRRNNIVLSLLLNKDAKGIDENKYSHIITALGLEKNIFDICTYIYHEKEQELQKDRKMPSEEKILKSLTTPYCIEKAYEYVLYLENMHEYAHDIEREFFAR